MYQALGPIGILSCGAAIALVLTTSRLDAAHSTSYHVAQDSKLHRKFALLMTIGLVLLAVSTLTWFTPHFSMPRYFLAIFLLALTLEVLATWVPLTTGWKYMFHQYTSYGAALLMPVVLTLIALSASVSVIARSVSAFATLAILVFLIFYPLAKSQRGYYLYYQVAYILCFFVGLLTTIYLG